MKKVPFLVSLLFLFSYAKAYQTVSFYVVAHPDDWQLFMSDYTVKDISDQQNKVVFIYLTSGDATFTNKTVNKSNYMSREKGAFNAVQFAADIYTKHLNGSFDKVVLNNHAVKRFSYKNTVSYFMRLPDGCDGKGFNGQSMALLRTGKISEIDAVDSTTKYYGWGDVIKTMKTMILNETGTVNSGTLNISDTSAADNPGDHHDHVNAGRAGIQATAGLHFLAKRYFTGYRIQYLPENLSTESIINKTAIFAATDFGRTQGGQNTSWSVDHLSYLSRTYTRQEPPHLALPGGQYQVEDAPGAFPNPAQYTVYVNFINPKAGDINYEIVDMLGRVNTHSTENKPEGKNTLPIDITGYTPGTYVVRISNGTNLASFQFVKM